MAGSERHGEARLSTPSPASLDDDDSLVESQESQGTSRAPSSRGSRSCDALSPSPSRHVSPPPVWSPSTRSPSHSAPNLLFSRSGGTGVPTAMGRAKLGIGPVVAPGPTRAKSPFAVSSADDSGLQQPQHPQLQSQPQQQPLLLPLGSRSAEARLHPPGSGDRHEDTPPDDRQTTTESQSQEHSSTRGGVNSWWIVPVVVLGACAGLLLLAVAALGTTYTYRTVIARLAAAERAANNHIGDLGNRSAFFTEDDGEVMALLPGGAPEYSDDRDDVVEDGVKEPRPRLWCFLSRLGPPRTSAAFGSKGSSSAPTRASIAPRGLCSALVYQGVRIVWRDAQASIDVDQPSNEEDLQRLAARRDVDPLLEVHVHVAGDQHPPPTSEASPADTSGNASEPSSTKEALRSLLRSPQGTTEVFAMRTARWLVAHHLDGLVVELASSVSGVAPELVTRLTEISHRQLGRMGKSFTLVLPESNTLFAQYDLDALLTTRGLYPIQRTHLTSDLRRASCPAPYKDPNFGIEHVLNRTRSALGSRRRRQGLSRLFFSVSLLGAHFVLDQEPGLNASATFAPARFQGFMPYAQMCQLIMSDGWNARANLQTDCTEANKGIEWVSAFAPFSGDWILGLKGVIRGLAVFDVEGDDRDGYCGEKHVLLKRLRDLLS